MHCPPLRQRKPGRRFRSGTSCDASTRCYPLGRACACGMRAARLSAPRERADSQSDRTKKESAVAAWFSICSVISEPESSRFVPISQWNVWWDCARAPRRSVFRLDVIDSTRNEYRRDSPFHNPFAFRRFCAVASWHPACFGEECGRSLMRSEQFTHLTRGEPQ